MPDARLELARNPDLFLPTAQIGISLVSALGAAYGGDQVVERISAWLAESSWPFVARHAEGIALAIFVACFTYVSLILGELVPKRASLHRAEGLAILVGAARPFHGDGRPAARVVHGAFDQHRFVGAAAGRR